MLVYFARIVYEVSYKPISRETMVKQLIEWGFNTIVMAHAIVA